jgi:hypothetical protein
MAALAPSRLSERGGEYLVLTGDWTLWLVRVGSLDFYRLLFGSVQIVLISPTIPSYATVRPLTPTQL